MLENREVPTVSFSLLNNALPDSDTGASTMSLLPNGDVLAKQGRVQIGVDLQGHPIYSETTSGFYVLTPDNQGDFLPGTWTRAASMNVTRQYYPSNQLPNGDLFVFGGENAGNGFDGNTTKLYDPQANSWSFTSSTFPQQDGGDVPSEVLASGQVLIGSITSTATYLFTPATAGQPDKWTFAGNRLHNDTSSEESWVLLQDGSVLSYDVTGSWNSQTFEAQRYIPGTNGAVGQWVDASQTTGTVPILNDVALGTELGPAILLADGQVFQIGGNSHTALYTPSTNTWTAGQDMPTKTLYNVLTNQNQTFQLTADDAPAAELPNGDVLLALSPAVTGNFTNNSFPANTFLFEYSAANGFVPVEQTTSLGSFLGGNGNLNSGIRSNEIHMLDLPNGHVLLSLGVTPGVWDSAPDSTVPLYRPTVTSVAYNSDGTYTLTGTGLTGFSEGAAYGDDAEMSTNFPIVKLTSAADGTVWYANSFNWTPGVADTASRTVQFAQPYDLPSGQYYVSVVASGISSVPNGSNVSITAIQHYYADTVWQGMPTFTYVDDADPVAPGMQPGRVGVNCFGSVSAAISHAQAFANSTVTVNGAHGVGSTGNYAEAVAVNAQINVNLQAGPVSFYSLSGQSTAHVILSGSSLTLTDNTDTTFAGTLTNVGGLTKTGTGTSTLSGTETGSGAVTVSAGILVVSGAITGSGGVTVATGGSLKPTTAMALAATTVTVGVSNGLDLSALSAFTLGGLAGTGSIGLSGKTLTIGADNADTTYGGVFTGNGSLVKAGYGTTTLSGLNNYPALGATVDGGILATTGTFTGNNSYVITVPVGGSGTFRGVSPTAGGDSVDATVNVSGTLGAGTDSAPGQLGVRSLNMAAGNDGPGTFVARLFGALPGTGDGHGYDQVTVFGPADIDGATLDLIPKSFNEFATGTTFTLIQDQATPITGIFDNMPEGAVVSAGGNYFRISYNGGAAVTLTTIDAPVATDQNGRAVIRVNDGSAQRSEVRSISVTYSTLVTFVGDPGDAFSLLHIKSTVNVGINFLHGVATASGGHTTVTLTFTTYANAPTEVDPISGENLMSPSLADGRYQLSTGTYTSPTDTSGGGSGQLGLFRLFGDVDGNGAANSADQAVFNNAYNTIYGDAFYLAYLDANNNGAINGLDLAQFNMRLGTSVL